MTNDWENIAYFGRIWAKGRCWRTSLVCLKYSWGLWEGVATPGKFCNFPPLLSLETVFPALKLTQNCYLNIKISSFWKTGNLFHKVERLFSQSNKIWNQCDFKNPKFSALFLIGKIWNCNLGVYSKNPISHLFHEKSR